MRSLIVSLFWILMCFDVIGTSIYYNTFICFGYNCNYYNIYRTVFFIGGTYDATYLLVNKVDSEMQHL